MRALEYLFYGIATFLFGWFSLRVFVSGRWSDQHKAIFSFLFTAVLFVGFAIYRLSTGEEATDRIQELLFCTIYKFPHCPSPHVKLVSAQRPNNQTSSPTARATGAAEHQPSTTTPQAGAPKPENNEPLATVPKSSRSENTPARVMPLAPPRQEIDHRPRYIVLNERNAKDIWSTSVFSYAPGGGGPGGGLENDRLRVGGWSDEYVALIQFDLPDADCDSKVTLDLYNVADGAGPTAMYLRVITQPWSWQRGDRLWWRDLPSSTPWQNRVVPAPGVNAWTSIDLSDLFAKWCSKELPNYGIMLRPVSNNNNFNSFFSTRSTAAGYSPRLVVAN